LNNGKIGINLICGNSFVLDRKLIKISIGPILNWKIEDISCTQGLKNLVNYLIEYFIPYYFETEVQYLFKHSTLELDENNLDIVFALGYNTYL
jgi:hypothetical protein